ncbi:MAG: hypothetical protein P8Z78_12280 [Gammaproteobacteria bacterium]|jgi:hypothetical protein
MAMLENPGLSLFATHDFLILPSAFHYPQHLTNAGEKFNGAPMVFLHQRPDIAIDQVDDFFTPVRHLGWKRCWHHSRLSAGASA